MSIRRTIRGKQPLRSAGNSTLVKSLLILSGLLFSTVSVPERRGAAHSVPHDSHVIFGRMVVEDDAAIVRVRMFKDDLALVLRTYAQSDALEMIASAAIDSVFESYFNDMFLLRSEGTRMQAQILSSGEEQMRADGGVEDVWWYMLEFNATAPIEEIGVNNAMFFETFSDQRNILKVLHTGTEREHSFYFASGDTQEQRLRF